MKFRANFKIDIFYFYRGNIQNQMNSTETLHIFIDINNNTD